MPGKLKQFAVPRIEGGRIRHYRVEAKFTQQALADALAEQGFEKKDKDTISRYERDVCTPSPSMIEQLAQILDIPPLNFYNRDVARVFAAGLVKEESNVVVNEEQVSHEEQSRHLDDLLEMYEKMPARYSGREFEIVFENSSWYATGATDARALNLAVGETIEASIKVRDHWLTAWASGDVAEYLCQGSEGESVEAICLTIHGTVVDEDVWTPTPDGLEPKVKDLKGFVVCQAKMLPEGATSG